MLQLPTHYTSQHNRVYTVHLALTLSNSVLLSRVYSTIQYLIPTITFKDTTWTQTLMPDKQVVTACCTVSVT